MAAALFHLGICVTTELVFANVGMLVFAILIFHAELADCACRHPRLAEDARSKKPSRRQRSGALAATSRVSATTRHVADDNFRGNLAAGVGIGAVTVFVWCHNILGAEWRQIVPAAPPDASDDAAMIVMHPSGFREIAEDDVSHRHASHALESPYLDL